MEAPSSSQRIHFGSFELDRESGELLKNGRRIRLQEQPLQVLLVLLEKPNHVVTREELQQRLWPRDTFVDFEHGLNAAINRLRQVLDDSAEEPRFIYVAFQWCPEGPGTNCDIYIKQVGVEPPFRLTTDPAEDFSPAWSPDGRFIAFLRQLSPTRVALMLIPQRGGQERVLGETNMTGFHVTPFLAWTPDSKGLVFPSEEDENIWRVDLRDPGWKPSTPVRFISSTRPDFYPAYSPNGKKIAFNSIRSGAREIWLCDSDGSNPMQLTSFGESFFGPSWSPDGQSIAFFASSGGNQDVYVIGANGGAPRRLTADPADDKWPYWSRDGQSIYFVSNRSGSYQIWKMPASGGEAVQITPNGETRDMPQESPDGKFVYYMKGWPSQCSVWRMPVGGGKETEVLDSVHSGGLWTVWKQGIYFFRPADEKGGSDMGFYEFASGKTRKILTIERPLGHYIAASPDGRTILYTQDDQSGSDLMLVENFL